MYRTQKMFQNFPLCAIWTKHFSGSAYKHSTNLSRNLLVFSPFLISVRRPGAPAPSQRLLAHHQMPARLEVQPHGVLHVGRHRCNGLFFISHIREMASFSFFLKKILLFQMDWVCDDDWRGPFSQSMFSLGGIAGTLASEIMIEGLEQ